MNATLDTMLAQRARALVLDPDVAVRTELARALEARKVSTRSAPDGGHGVALLLEELLALDALVVNLDLPGRDARAFAHLVRRAGGERDLAIVVLASAPTASLRAELLALGVDRVVDARLGPGRVADAIVEVVRVRRADPCDRDEPVPPAPPPEPGASGWSFGFGRLSLLPA